MTTESVGMKIEKPRCYFTVLTAHMECITVEAGEGGDMDDFVPVPSSGGLLADFRRAAMNDERRSATTPRRPGVEGEKDEPFDD
jgi:hypothetical protein